MAKEKAPARELKGAIVPFTFRMPEDVYEWSREQAAKDGVPQNAFLLMLMQDGRRFREAKIAIAIHQE